MIADEIRIRQTFDPTGENGGYKFESGLEDKPEPMEYSEGFVTGITGIMSRQNGHGAITGRWRDMSIGQIVEKGARTYWSNWRDWAIQTGQAADRLHRENPCGEVMLTADYTKVEKRLINYCETDARITRVVEEKARHVQDSLEAAMTATWNDMLRIEE